MAEHYDVNGLVDFLLPRLQSNPFRCQCLRHLSEGLIFIFIGH